MQKLLDLTSYLRNPTTLKKAGIKCNPERIHSEAKEGTPDWLGETSASGIYLFDQTYRVEVDFEEVAGNIELLIGLIMVWLKENDPDRNKLDDPKVRWEGIPFDEKTSDITVSLSFYEKIHMSLAPENSPNSIEIDGVDYEIAEETIRIAEEMDPIQTQRL